MVIHRDQTPGPDARTIDLVVDGTAVSVADDGSSLLAVLREHLGITAAKDGCSPQGQCGCCTVLVDGAPRVACVTPARRVAGRVITTSDGLGDDDRRRWADAFVACGASQCGFCTPGIICRLEGLRAKGTAPDDRAAVDRALAAHLCRCTGWQTIGEAWAVAASGASALAGTLAGERDLKVASRRAGLEGHTPQQVGADVVLGHGGFADDSAPPDALVAVPDGAGGWAVGETLAEARAASGKVQGRRGTVEPVPPLAVPDGDWELTLCTSWVEPAYLETDASWCEPGGEPAGPLGNGGAFGGKVVSPVTAAARELADRHGRAVRVLLSREDTVRLGPKRPPVAAGVRADGTGVMRVVRTPGVADAVRAMAPGLVVEEVDVAGPPTSAAVRAAGWAEASVLLSALAARRDGGSHEATVTSPWGSVATASVGADDVIRVHVECGEVLDEVVLRSYVIGAAHMALGWVTSEGLAVDADGNVGDLTVRSFGIVRAADMPTIEVAVVPSDRVAINGSDAAFAAVASALWLARGCPPSWPVGS
ncbi:2Fe-2S iron-sulfur cluster-binding protein [Rhabdothermincola salaria]|uniref:2Fe-2S iron-sulfur cluster-binding protein n=1 Tax=Rhabdothermincola salaria TaxID=2903142 RepID=UPI001E2E0579|nr:2Fe-2S iron-sulfur cluster-binding protein [Rhabdothermincola salaria]MCD9624602.1 2Fe-2S iron-sulfur cluster-binding protein [Rhabdothermincola salaria]